VFAWQGKVFDAPEGVLKNHKTSTMAQRIRDEIRMIQPGLYPGNVYWNKDRLIDFCLEL
jgi:hypothetical protein